MNQIKNIVKEWQIPDDWRDAVGDFEKKLNIQSLKSFLQSEIKNNQTIYPAQEDYFKALSLTPLDTVKVVILGQDPYHGVGQAHGLSFSVPFGTKIPPSLLNIYKELKSDLNLSIPNHGNLEYWARQGVLLLNSVLTVRASEAASHQGRGWEALTDQIIKTVGDTKKPVVFMLWGAYAHKKELLIDKKRHLILKAPHPSPLSAYRGFFGCQNFSKANKFLKKNNRSPIQWQLKNHMPTSTEFPLFDTT